MAKSFNFLNPQFSVAQGSFSCTLTATPPTLCSPHWFPPYSPHTVRVATPLLQSTATWWYSCSYLSTKSKSNCYKHFTRFHFVVVFVYFLTITVVIGFRIMCCFVQVINCWILMIRSIFIDGWCRFLMMSEWIEMIAKVGLVGLGVDVDGFRALAFIVKRIVAWLI